MGLAISKTFKAVYEMFAGTEARIVMIGLDGAGKTTLYQWLKSGEVMPSIPTVGFQVDSVKISGLTLQLWDMGGQYTIRKLWKRYIEGADALVFVVDSADESRMAMARKELESMLGEPELAHVPVLILANKQDLPAAKTASALSADLGLGEVKNDNYVQPCVATRGEGIDDGFSWLCTAIKEHRRANAA